jgi:ABC-type antimicrobial peptide transport system ATPase subunit
MLANSCSLGSLGTCFTKKNLNFTMYMHEINGFIYTLVMQHLGLINIICHAIICTIEGDQDMQYWVKLG